MNRERKTEIKVGVTAFLALLIFVFIYGWAKNFSFNSEKQLVNVEFSTVAGLELGDLVSVNGVKRGLVENIRSSTNSAIVTIEFIEPTELKEDATFSIMMLDLMGGKKIEINSGNSTNHIDYNKLQKGNFSGDISTAMATLSSVENDLVEVIRELKLSLENVNSVFSSEGFIDNVKSSAANLDELSRNMNDLLIENKNNFTQILENTKKLTQNTNALIDSNKEQLSSLLNNLDSTLSNSNELITKFNRISDEIVNSENNIGKLLYNEELFNDLVISIQQIKELTTTINKQLKSGGLEVKADVDLF